MNISGKHKAAIITSAIFSTLFFILSIIKISTHLSIDKFELYYELESLKDIIKQEIKKPIKSSSQSKKSNLSNKAINKLEDQKESPENSQQIPKETSSQIIKNENDKVFSNEFNKPKFNIEINNSNKELFNEINAFINKKQKASTPENSSFQYKLKNRTLIRYKTPAYQCQEAGTVVLNIGVNETGQVVLIKVNKASSSENKCLIESSINYGKLMQFSKSKEAIQYGTVSFFYSQR